MKPSVYWLSGFAVCGVLALVVMASSQSGSAPSPEGTTATAPEGASTTGGAAAPLVTRDEEGNVIVNKLERSDAEWKKLLTPEQYRILRQAGTERPGSGELLHNKAAGTYKCAGCGLPLFRSDGKFDSGCGWPSFFEPLEGAHITETMDTSHNMVRTEITCSRCDGHLGHVFTDGPAPTGLRYCVNSVSIEFDESKKDEAKDDADGK